MQNNTKVVKNSTKAVQNSTKTMQSGTKPVAYSTMYERLVGMRDRTIKFRITEQEYERIKKKTRDAGIRRDNVSEYVRRQVLGDEYPYVKERLLRQMNYQIRKIGVNINQITKRNNSELYFDSDKKQLFQDMEELKRLFREFHV